MLKILPILFAILLLGCKEELGKKERGCDAACEDRRKEFERSIDSVHIEKTKYDVLVTKTATGGFAEYFPLYREKWATAELSENEWLNFINAIYKCCIDKSYSQYYNTHLAELIKNLPPTRMGTYVGKPNIPWGTEYLKVGGEVKKQNATMNLKMIYSNKDNDFNEFLYGAEQSNWDEVEKIMVSITEIIRKKNNASIEAKLKSEYQKRFGEPISDIELSTNEIYFSLHGIAVTRTKTGAIANSYTELSIGEWLDFVRALYKSGAYEWHKEYGECNGHASAWFLEINFTYKIEVFEGCHGYPPNWSKFSEIMKDMRTKIINDSSGKELKSNLESEYQERFKTPITNIELSTNKVKFYTSKEKDGNRVSDTLSVTRTLDGAFAERCLSP